MRFKMIVTLLILVFAVIAYGIGVDVSDLVEERIRNSVSIEIASSDSLQKEITFGSGFLIGRKGYPTIIVTCKHVVNEKKAEDIFIGINTEDGKVRYLCKGYYTNKKYDIAILERGTKIEENNITTINIEIQNPAYIGLSIFIEDKELKEGKGTFIIGYPFGLGINIMNNEPVTKIGIVAQRVNIEKKTFLVDGISNPGNSGSPVYESNQGRFIGMVSKCRNDFIDLFTQEGGHIAKLPYNSGLTYCVSADAILEMIKEYYKLN